MLHLIKLHLGTFQIGIPRGHLLPSPDISYDRGHPQTPHPDYQWMHETHYGTFLPCSLHFYANFWTNLGKNGHPRIQYIIYADDNKQKIFWMLLPYSDISYDRGHPQTPHPDYQWMHETHYGTFLPCSLHFYANFWTNLGKNGHPRIQYTIYADDNKQKIFWMLPFDVLGCSHSDQEVEPFHVYE